MPDRTELDIYAGRTRLGTVVRSGHRCVYVYDATGAPLGCYGDLDSAIRALTERQKAAAA
jgi:hypothetical protein